ncbi:MAG: DUF3352 domain-containing protein [Thermoleophilaceae bacterium]|nr:DUF3352 domain-containing protein [Thermoleophilaceae bacterium]
MRLAAAAGLAVLAFALAGCGADSASEPKSPLDAALAVLPEDAPFVMVFETDPEGPQVKNALALTERFPLSGQIKDRARQEVEQDGLDLEEDLLPILGNPFVIGARTPQDLDGDSTFVGAFEAKDDKALDQLIERGTKEGDLKELGEEGEATVYQADDSFYGIDGSTVVLADTREDLNQALEMRDGKDHLTEKSFDEKTGQVAKDALLRVMFDTRALIAASKDPDSAVARRIPWVKAFTTAGVAISAGENDASLEFDMRGDKVAPVDLPIAPGAASPPVLQPGGDREITMALRDLGHVIEFGERAGKTADPQAFKQYEFGKQAIKGRFGVDLDTELTAQLRGESQLTLTPDGRFAMRADLRDPEKFEDTLERSAKFLPDALDGAGLEGAAIEKPRGSQRLYAIALPGGDSIAYGVIEDKFVVSNSPDRTASLAGAATQEVPGAQGALAGQADGAALAKQVIDAQGRGAIGGLLGDTLTDKLEEITFSLRDDPGSLRGRASLRISP